jgi:imidazolonepropionase-like amidohydrolase
MRLAVAIVYGMSIGFSNPVCAQAVHGSVTFRNVTVIPMDRERVLPGRTVVIQNGRIVKIGSSRTVRLPAGAVEIDGTRRYLLPGLADAHVHIFGRDELLL